jgi:hypothetical protein
MINFVSAAILCLLLIGRRFRHRHRLWHIRIMWVVIILDTVLVVYLSVFKNVLTKINATMSPLLMIHIGFALTTLVCYYLAIFVGIKLSRGQPGFREKMRVLDHLIVPLRMATLLTSILLKM